MATSSRLFIGNVNYKTNAETIGHLFETIGGVYAYMTLMLYIYNYSNKILFLQR
jgi:hypothetical protein